MTRATLIEPLAFVETGIDDLLSPDKQPSVLYAGPVEWDRSGDYTYLLWVQVAPGVGGHRIGDIRERSAIILELDDEAVSLPPLELPVKASNPYAPIEPVGQASYFSIDVALLQRMAASRRVVFRVRAADLSMVDFVPRNETQHTLTEFLADRSISAD